MLVEKNLVEEFYVLFFGNNTVPCKKFVSGGDHDLDLWWTKTLGGSTWNVVALSFLSVSWHCRVNSHDDDDDLGVVIDSMILKWIEWDLTPLLRWWFPNIPWSSRWVTCNFDFQQMWTTLSRTPPESLLFIGQALGPFAFAEPLLGIRQNTQGKIQQIFITWRNSTTDMDMKKRVWISSSCFFCTLGVCGLKSWFLLSVKIIYSYYTVPYI